jgi:competence protein ComEA
MTKAGGGMMVSGLQKRFLLIMALVIVILGCSFYSFWQKNTVISSTSSISLPPETVVNTKSKGSEIVIYISGAVNQPGVFKVPAGSRAFEAIEIAGGLAPGADRAKINLAQMMKDGMHIHVPGGAATIAGMASPTRDTVQSADKMSINSATQADFDKLPGIGPALAARIVEYRQANGAFRDITELKNVPGIGESKFNKFKDKITI